MLLFFYCAKYYLKIVFLSLAALVMLVVLVNLIEHAGHLLGDGAWRLLLRASLAQAVEYSYLLLPMASFIGAFASAALLSQSGEMMAAQTAGIAPWRLYIPWLVSAMMLSCVLFLLSEVALPFAKKQQQELAIFRPSWGNNSGQRVVWFKHQEMLLHVPSAPHFTPLVEFQDVHLYCFQQGQLLESWSASKLLYLEGSFWLENPQEHVHGAHRQVIANRLLLPMSLHLQDILQVTEAPYGLSFLQLRRLLQRQLHWAVYLPLYAIELHQRLQKPLLLWLLVWVALPYALSVDRRRPMLAALSFAVGVLLLALALDAFCHLLAKSQKLPPFLGVWLLPFLLVLGHLLRVAKQFYKDTKFSAIKRRRPTQRLE